jgi:phage recombination protein Bet
MNTSLQVINQNEDLTQFTPKQLQLIITTVAKGATPEELQLFLYRCKLLDLNPLKPGQIFFIKYGQGAGTIVVGIDGFRSNAGRTGKHVSTTRGVLKEGGQITYGWARVKRRDQAGEVQEFYEEVPIEEFYNDKNPSWKKMPETMIKKCAEAAALRMAYPDRLGGVYEEAERDAIEKDAATIKTHISPDQPNANDGDETARLNGQATFKLGSLKGRTPEGALKSLGFEKCSHIVDLVQSKLDKGELYAGCTREEMQKDLDMLVRVLTDFENGVIENE